MSTVGASDLFETPAHDADADVFSQRVVAATLGALDAFLEVRGKAGGETVLLRAIEALQGERYLRLAERRPANEAFLYGWLANRIGER